VPVAGKDTGPAFETALRDCIASALGAAYRPKRIVVLDALPKTRNLKTMRRVIRALLIGEEPGDLSSLLNPESLDPIRAAGAGK
jgi:acetyl-CoA synthetase